GTRFEPLYQLLPPLIAKMRSGGGPVLVEAEVVRLESHSSSDDQSKYRSAEELQAIRERDPVVLAEQYLVSEGIYSKDEIQQIREGLQKEINQAADEADAQPEPAAGHILTHIYSDGEIGDGGVDSRMGTEASAPILQYKNGADASVPIRESTPPSPI